MKTSHQTISNAVGAILDAAEKAEAQTFSEAEFVQDVVEEFGNNGQLRGPLAAVAVATNETQVSVKLLLTDFRMQLKQIACGQVSKGFRANVYYEADRLVLVPRTSETDVKFQFFPESLEAVIAYVSKLLIKGPYGTNLKQCQLAQCDRFFFVNVRRQNSGKKETGRKPDKYCSTDHMMIAHRERATAATLRRRKELKERRDAKRIAAARRQQEQKK
jgi:hypothetical protein